MNPEQSNRMTFEDVLARDGKLIYTNVGDSMFPLIREGRDLLVIRPVSGRLKKYDVPLYRRDSGQYVLHRILRVRKNDYVICGDNRSFCETGITDRHIIGVLSAVIRDGKELPCTDWRYRLYVRLWCDLFPLRALLLRVYRKLKRTVHGTRRQNTQKRSVSVMAGLPKIFFKRKFLNFYPVRKFIGLNIRICDLFDKRKDMKICGCSLVKYVPSLYRETLGATGSQSTCYWVLDRILGNEQFDENDSFLDVGCGKGRILAYMVKRGFPCKLTGIELNEEVAAFTQAWAKRYDNLEILCGNAFELDYNAYSVLFLARPFETEMFKKFVDVFEKQMTHPMRIFYWCDTQSGFYLEGRPGWKKLRQEFLFRSHGLFMFRCPQRYSVWEYTP